VLPKCSGHAAQAVAAGEARESRKTRLALFAYVRRRYVGSSALRVNVRDYL
jgi:hypothetical protein